MSPHQGIRDHFLPPNRAEYRDSEPSSGRIIVIAPTRAACETIELGVQLEIETVLERDHGHEVRELASRRVGFGIVAGTGTGKTLAIRPIAEETLHAPLKVGVVNREREATPETPSWNVVIVTTGIARRWFQEDLISERDTLVIDEIHQTSAELELCLALGKRVGCRFIWMSATVDPSFYARYLESAEVLETSAFDPNMAAKVRTISKDPAAFLDASFIRRLLREKRGVAVFLPTRAEVEEAAAVLGYHWGNLNTAFYHGGEPIRVIKPFLEGSSKKPFLLAMTQAGQSALNIQGLDTVVIADACYNVVIDRGRNVLTRQHLSANEILQMAGRVHGRVPGSEVFLLSDRDIDFESLEPTAPSFQLAGDSERVALTAAALGINLSDLELPVPLDRKAYKLALEKLNSRGLVRDGRLTRYGRDVEALPVDRPWGELLVHASATLVPFVAVAANIDSLHRMTRDDPDLDGLIVSGSDHLSGYNIYAEAVAECGRVGKVYGLERHQFDENADAWSENRGVLLKAIEDIALGTASVLRTLELPFPELLPRARRQIVQEFRELVASIMPFDLVIDGETSYGQSVRVSRSSVCNPHSAVAGTLSYFADRFGIPRASIEGTNIPLKLIQRYSAEASPEIELQDTRNRSRLYIVRRTEYFGFTMDLRRKPLVGKIPKELLEPARLELARCVAEGKTTHPDQGIVGRATARLNEFWRRSGGELSNISPGVVQDRLVRQLDGVDSWEAFLASDIKLDVGEMLAEEDRLKLESLPAYVNIRGNRIPLTYGLEGNNAIVAIRLRESLARRLRRKDLPVVDRPLHFSVVRGKREVLRAESFDDLQRRLRRLPERHRKHSRRRRRR